MIVFYVLNKIHALQQWQLDTVCWLVIFCSSNAS